eukprot:s2560_g5.t1
MAGLDAAFWNGDAVMSEPSRLRKHDYISTPMVQFVKTKLCKHFTKGYCKFEDKCFFAHDISELVCQRFMALGVCFNDHCSFAHGIEELREINRVPPAAWATSLQDGVGSLATSSAEETFENLPSIPPGFETLWSQIPEPEFGTQQDAGQIETMKRAYGWIGQQCVQEKTEQPVAMPRRNPNKISPQPPFNEMTDRPDEERWLLLVGSLQRRRRAEMLESGRMLLDRARQGQVAAEESVSSILLREPAWCVEFEHLARRYSECLRVTSTLREPGFRWASDENQILCPCCHQLRQGFMTGRAEFGVGSRQRGACAARSRDPFAVQLAPTGEYVKCTLTCQAKICWQWK